jgi:hypothetical protein
VSTLDFKGGPWATIVTESTGDAVRGPLPRIETWADDARHAPWGGGGLHMNCHTKHAEAVRLKPSNSMEVADILIVRSLTGGCHGT